MLIKTILNKVHSLQGFTYGKVVLDEDKILVRVDPRKGSRGRCGTCHKKGPTYDTSRTLREFLFIPLWGITVTLLYAMRRIQCRTCGVTTEIIPWADGKNRTCNAFRILLSQWARRLSWQEVSKVFNISWGVVYRSIEWVVAYGLKNRDLGNVGAIGVDEMAMWSGHKYVTVVYQIDAGIRRLLWIGKDRTESTLHSFFFEFGEARAKALQFVASDMWRPYLSVIKHHASQAIHVLDRYHVVAKLNKALDEVRSKEAKQLIKDGYDHVLKNARWCFLKKEENLTDKQSTKLGNVLKYDLRSVRAYLLKESFNMFWTYKSAHWAGWFLDAWCKRAMRSRLDPIKKFVGTVRNHRELLLNWFRAKQAISSGVVEGFNTNAKLALRKARGFKSYEVLCTALYHQLGRLPEPQAVHRF